MVMSINTNLPSLGALRPQDQAQSTRTLESLSSGKSVNSAKDDAAASAIIAQFSAQIAGNNQAARNLNDGVSLVQVADGALDTLQDNTQRLRELSIAAANGTLNASDRAALQEEANQLQQSSADIVGNTQFNGNPVFQSTTQSLQAGPNANQQLDITGVALSGAGGEGGLYSASGAIDLSTADGARNAISQLDADNGRLATVAANYGAIQNRIEAAMNGQSSSAITQSAARSRMGDTDYAKASSDLIRQQMIGQSTQAMQAQANAAPQQVLSLLR